MLDCISAQKISRITCLMSNYINFNVQFVCISISQKISYRTSGFINCELRVFLHFTINRFANLNMHAYYSTVRGRPSQLLDS